MHLKDIVNMQFFGSGSGKYEAWRLLLSDVEMNFANIELI